MDILYLTQYFHPEQFLNNHVAQALVERGHRVRVVCCVPNYPAGHFFPGYSNFRRKRENWNGIDVNRVFTVPRGRSAVQLIANYFVYPIAASWRIIRLGRRRGQISFVSMPSPLLQALAGIFAKKVLGLPTVYWVQDIWPDSAIITLGLRNRLIVKLLVGLCAWIYRQADLVMVQSDGFHGKIAEFGVDPAHIVTLSNTAPDFFRPIAVAEIPDRIRKLIPPGRRTLMFAGNIGESQDFETIVAAAALLPPDLDFLIIVVGSGRHEAKVEQLVNERQLQDRFLFLGRHPEADMPALFACADAMLVSLRDEPIFALTVPSKVQAYLACGKPVLASLSGEGAAIIERAGAGEAVPPGDPVALSAAYERIATMPAADLNTMGDRAYAHYRAHFSLPAVTGMLVDHLRLVLSRQTEDM